VQRHICINRCSATAYINQPMQCNGIYIYQPMQCNGIYVSTDAVQRHINLCSATAYIPMQCNGRIHEPSMLHLSSHFSSCAVPRLLVCRSTSPVTFRVSSFCVASCPPLTTLTTLTTLTHSGRAASSGDQTPLQDARPRLSALPRTHELAARSRYGEEEA
jgi:hypothetical protein